MTGIAASLGTVRGWLADQDLFEWVEPRGGVVGFPRFRPSRGRPRCVLPGPARPSRHARRARPLVRASRAGHFRLGYGWPTADALEQGLAALLASAVEAWDGPRPGRPPAGAAMGNALLEMDRQIFRDVPRVEEMVKPGARPSGCRATAAWSCGSRRSEPARRTPLNRVRTTGTARRSHTTTAPGRPAPSESEEVAPAEPARGSGDGGSPGRPSRPRPQPRRRRCRCRA